MNEVALPAAAPRGRPWRNWVFVALMLALTVLFLGLGKWQLDRLGWKEGLMKEAEQRMHLPAAPLPPVAEWGAFDPQAYVYRSVTVTGHYLPNQAVRVFIGLSEAKGEYSGPGDWIMTPFALDGGGTVFVNRGFVPENLSANYLDDKTAPAGTVTLTGVAVLSEEAYPFTPGPEPAKRLDWIRNVDRLSKMVDPALRPIAPIYIDLPAGPPGALPQGGETTVDLPNNHLGYAATWFGFALTTIIMLAEWLRRQRKGGQQDAD